MTCAACASRIERKLNKLDGVTATVNYATEQARVEVPDDAASTMTVDDLIATIEATGYGAHLPSDDVEQPDRFEYLRKRLFVAVVLGMPVLALSMIPALQFDGWQWVALVLATPVANVGGVAVPPGDGAQPPSRPDDDGHADLGRSDGRVPVVGVGVAVHRRRRRRDDDVDVARRARRRRRPPHLPRGRIDGRRVHPRRAVLRGERETPCR